MKYVRKIVALLIAVIIIAAIAIGLGVIFSVRNVNVTLLSYSYEAEGEQANAKISEFKREILAEVKGRLISSVNEKKVVGAISDSKFTVESCIKSYPCTLNVTIKERREVFAVENPDGGYLLYDEDGVLLRTAVSYSEAINPDGGQNLLIEGANAEELESIAQACAVFKAEFSSLRSVVEKVVLIPGNPIDKDPKLSFELRCGLKITIDDYGVHTKEKIKAAYDKFITLSGKDKLSGELISLYTNDGAVSVSYKSASNI